VPNEALRFTICTLVSDTTSLGAFALSRKARVGFIMRARLSASINAVLTGMIPVKFGIGVLDESLFEIGQNFRGFNVNTYIRFVGWIQYAID
jgi:hypothetical protein